MDAALRETVEAPGNARLDLRPGQRPGPAALGLPDRLRMLDQVDGHWPEARRWRARHQVEADRWFFKSHFYQDPVQPGSLGLEAMLQLARVAAVESGRIGATAPMDPLLGRPMKWSYRGQVAPTRKQVTVVFEEREAAPGRMMGDADLWVDGLRIYRAEGLGLRGR